MLVTKLHSLAQGYSGVQLSTLERILWHLDNDVLPVVPEKGSVGASGDLARWRTCFCRSLALARCCTTAVGALLPVCCSNLALLPFNWDLKKD
jgi:hypothetical protein